MKPISGTFRPVSPSPLAEPAVPQKTMLPSAYESASPPSESEDENDDKKQLPLPLLHKLRKFPLFKDAPKNFHSKVAAKLSLIQYRPQEFIIKENDPALAMYWILKGTVSVALTDGESIYAELAPGSFFGEIGILFNRPRTATVVACLRVLVGVLTADALNSVLRSYPLIERRIRDEAQERLAMQEKKNKADIPIVQPSRTPAPTGSGPVVPCLPPSFVLPSASPLPLSLLLNASEEDEPRKPSTLADNVDQTVSIQGFIKSVPIFQNLPSNIVHSLALGAEPASFMPFEYIFRKGQSGSDIYFITHGEVEVVGYTSANAERVLARLRSGAFFGEMAFLELIQGNTNLLRSASIRSVLSVELIVIRTDLLKDVCTRYPSIVEEIKATAAARKNSNETPDNDDANLFSMRNSVHESFRSPPILPSLPGQFSFPFSVNTTRKPSVSSTEVSTPQLLFMNPNWNFGSSESLAHGRGGASRSVSPVSLSDIEAPMKPKVARGIDEIPPSRKRSPAPEISLQQLPQGPLDMVVPPKNPLIATNAFLAGLRKNSFQYMPHNKRIKLSNLAGRRRSSVLVSTGTIPDKVLLGAFEFLDLPKLMKLRLVSRRWRQLLYIAPNLCKRLDLSLWNTLINDDALMSITDFVGSRPRYIDISNCFHVTDEGFSYLVNEVGMAGNITVFKMRSLWEVSAMAIMDLTSPSVGKDLQEVDLSNCRKVQDNVVERLIGWAGESTGATRHLPGSEGTYNNEAGSRRLKILNLSYCKHLTDNIMYHIAFHANEKLECLDLTRCTTITDAGFQHWTYRSFPNLKKLLLRDCTFLSDKAIISLASAAPNLEILNLNFCCALLDLAIEALCQGCPNLRELDLSFCGSAVSDSSLVSISLRLFNLEKLILKGCVRVTRAGVDSLLSGYSPLAFIDISQCRNAHEYPGRIPAQSLQVNPSTKSAFISTGAQQRIVELVI